MVPQTPEMANKLVQITLEILDILGTATYELEQKRLSEFDLCIRFHEADIISERVLKRVVGWTNLEARMKKLDILINEEAVMAISQQHMFTYTHNIV